MATELKTLKGKIEIPLKNESELNSLENQSYEG